MGQSKEPGTVMARGRPVGGEGGAEMPAPLIETNERGLCCMPVDTLPCYGVRMVTPTTAFRLTDYDRHQLERLSDELGLSRTDVVRHGLAALRRDPALRKQIRAEQLAIAFLNRLRARYGEHTQLRLVVGPDQPEPDPRIADEPLDWEELDVRVRYEGDFAFVDLVDPTVGVGIWNAYWTEVGDHKDVRILLKAIDLYVRLAPTDEPRTHRLGDGRTVLAVPQDDGSVTQLVLDSEGNSRLLPADQHADWFWDNEVPGA